MILHVEFRADVDRWRVRVVETGFTRDVPNLVGYDVRGPVVSMGDIQPEIGAGSVRVVPIYGALSFDPANTARAVRFYTTLAHQGVRRGLAHVLDLFDRYDLTLELPGYSEIAADLRQAFERDLNAMTFVLSYSINGYHAEARRD